MNRSFPILAATLLVAGCPSDDHPLGDSLEVTRITPQAPAIAYYTSQREPLRVAIFDEKAFADLWARAFTNLDPAPARPRVDFEREFVVAAALGERRSGGFGIEVAGASAAEGGIAAEILTISPGRNCVLTDALTQPLDIVKVPRPTARAVPVRFSERAVVRDCD